MVDVRGNPHIQAAAVARRPTRWWFALILGIIVAIVTSTATGGVIPAAEGSIASQFVQGLGGILAILLVLLWIGLKERRPVRSIGFTGRRGLIRFAAGVAIGAGMLVAATLLMVGAGGVERVEAPDGVTTGSAALVAGLVVFITWVFQASSEEVIFRGFVFQSSGLQIPGLLAILVPSVVFAALHLFAEDALQPVAVFNLILYASFACLVALADRGLWFVAGIHTGWNWFQGNVMGLAVSGNLNDNTVFAFGAADGEPKFLSGGAFGIEGTFGTTVVMLLGAVVAIAVIRRRDASGVPTRPGVKV